MNREPLTGYPLLYPGTQVLGVQTEYSLTSHVSPLDPLAYAPSRGSVGP
jgi:hypothetical protein